MNCKQKMQEIFTNSLHPCYLFLVVEIHNTLNIEYKMH